MAGAKRARQVAALPTRTDKSGAIEVLLVTSRDTKRWIVPKGWPMEGRSPWKAAAIEALEEAGVEGDIARKPLGTYTYVKRRDRRPDIPCEVAVYPMQVERQLKRWKERDQRERHWFAPAKAADLVDESDLGALLAALDKTSRDKRA